MTDSQAPLKSTIPPRPRPFVWCLGAIVGVALATAISVNLPDRIKLLGLFPLIWGGLIGIGLKWWADEMELPIRGWPTMLSGLLLAAGEIGMVLGGWLVYRVELRRQFDKQPAVSIDELVLSKRGGQSALPAQSEAVAARRKMEQELDASIRERQTAQLQFSTFLYRRIHRLGDLSTPWPEVFWGCEIVFGTLAGVWCLRNGISTKSPVQNVETTAT